MHRRREVHIATAEAKLIYYFSLPQEPMNMTSEYINCSQHLSSQNRASCRGARLLLESYRLMRQRAFRYMHRHINDVYDILHNYRPRGRPVRGFLTDALSKITGLASMDELQGVRDTLYKIEQGIQTAADAWRTGTSHFMAAFQVTKARIDSIRELQGMQAKSILSIQSEVIQALFASHTRSVIIGRIVQAFTALYSKSQNWTHCITLCNY